MDQYDKLLYIDVDFRLRKNLDYIFEHDVHSSMYFMKDILFCDDYLTNGGYSSGLMLFKPDKELFDHVLKTAAQMEVCWVDQFIIFEALRDTKASHRKMKWFSQETVAYPQCDSHQKADAVHFVLVKPWFTKPKAVYDYAKLRRSINSQQTVTV
eukprot:gnl/MRDRNA2_/MRDRNA2_169135_c0_seq1.p1 gnl/MRDRNA2_/MRDRNA2_169135_c0~~gnl/MRDRNA2_/MRDRNA2_169135_c0_seq1.p1  ORF type:complete len:154 (+),score=19.41 gnl/MRDRNA2_/MRDRNA2_169135_c0_seq1:136-597(+)